MVEFALVIPVLVLLLLLAVDFGRVFFGWVGLQNVARIAANYAAQYPEADYGDPTDSKRITYNEQVADDSAAINCELPDPIPAPTFPNGTDPGDDAVVELECSFSLLTPFIGGITGNPIELNATSIFPIRAGVVGSPGGPPPGPPPPPTCRDVPDLIDLTVADARLAWSTAGFTGFFFPQTGQDAEIVVLQVPVAPPPAQCLEPDTTVTVATNLVPPLPCPATEVRVPKLEGLTVSSARSTWFGAGFNAGTFSPASGSNGQTVIQPITFNPSASVGDCRPPTTTVTVGTGSPPPAPNCTVPNFIGSNTIGAQSTWSAFLFTTTVSYKQPNSRPYTINEQSLVSNSSVPCNSNIQVGP